MKRVDLHTVALVKEALDHLMDGVEEPAIWRLADALGALAKRHPNAIGSELVTGRGNQAADFFPRGGSIKAVKP